MAKKRTTLASKLWEWAKARDEPFTATEASEALVIQYDTVNHYIRYWAKQGAVRRVKVAVSGGRKLGRPDNFWETVSDKYPTMWRR